MFHHSPKMTKLLSFIFLFSATSVRSCDKLPFEHAVIVLDTSSLNNMPQEFDGMRRFVIELTKWIDQQGSTAHVILFGEKFLILGTDVEYIRTELLAMQPAKHEAENEEELGSFDASFAFASVLRDINMRKKPDAATDQSTNLLPIFERFKEPVFGIMLYSTFLTPLPSRDVLEELHTKSSGFMTIDNGCGFFAKEKQDYLASEPSLFRAVNTFTLPADVLSLLTNVKSTICYHTKQATTKSTTTQAKTTTSTTIAKPTKSAKSEKLLKTTESKTTSTWTTPDQSSTGTTTTPETTSQPEATTKTPMKFYFRSTTIDSVEQDDSKTSFGGELTSDSYTDSFDLGDVADTRGLSPSLEYLTTTTSALILDKNHTKETANFSDSTGIYGNSSLQKSGNGHTAANVAGPLSSKYIIIILLVTLAMVVAIAVALAVLRQREKDQTEKFGVKFSGNLSKSPDELESLSSGSSTYKEPFDGSKKPETGPL